MYGLVLHRKDHNRDALESQLRRIGLFVTCRAPTGEPLGDGTLPAADVIFFDADLGYQGLFGWKPGEAPVPLVGVLSSEAPGRLEWALAQGATSYLLKPIGSTGAFNALVVATRLFAERRKLRGQVAELSERIRARPLVVRAVIAAMEQLGISDDQALGLLRRSAMHERVTLEIVCARIAAGGSLAGLADPPPAAPSTPLRAARARPH
jgi:AmiR/NasT family two-component response regulator